MTVDYPDFATPQAHATQIAAPGVPLLTLSTNVINDVGRNVPFGGGNVTVANLQNISQIGYEIAIAALISNLAPTLPILTVNLIWKDSITNTTVGHETWNIAIGSSGAGSLHIGTGPTKGNRLTVLIANNDSAQNATVTTIVNQNSRVYARDDWRTESFNSIPNAIVALHDQQGSTLSNFLSAPLAANGQVTRLLPLFAGRVSVAFSSAISMAGTLQITNLDPVVSAVSTFVVLANPANNLSQLFSLSLPRSACTFTLTDTSGLAGNTLQAMFVADEFVP